MQWTGPGFLIETIYPKEKVSVSEKCKEFRKELKDVSSKNFNENPYFFKNNIISFIQELINLNNNYLTVLCIVHFIFMFINNMKFSTGRVLGFLKTNEVKKAETFLLRKVQSENSPVELKSLKNKGTIKSTSK